MSQYPKYSEIQTYWWQLLRDQGMSGHQVAKETGVPSRTIYDHTQNPSNPLQPSPDEALVREWQRRRVAGETQQQIAERDGWGASTVDRHTITPLAQRKRYSVGRTVDERDVAAWIELIEAHYATVQEVARHYKRSPATVRAHVDAKSKSDTTW